MKLPGETSGYSVVVGYARYAARMLRTSGRVTMADDLTHLGQVLRTKGRAWEDAGDAVQDALADRDSADDGLDAMAQHGRNTLAGRSVSATREEPYTLIYPEGIGYYTAATLSDEVTRYTELARRTAEHLPEGDPVRVQTSEGVTAGLAAFTAGVTALETAETTKALARTELDRANRNLRRQLEKTYGALVSELGKAKAERFFPKAAKSKKDDDKEA